MSLKKIENQIEIMTEGLLLAAEEIMLISSKVEILEDLVHKLKAKKSRKPKAPKKKA